MGQVDVGWLQEICWVGGGVERSSIKLGLAGGRGEGMGHAGGSRSTTAPLQGPKEEPHREQGQPRALSRVRTAWQPPCLHCPTARGPAPLLCPTARPALP